MTFQLRFPSISQTEKLAHVKATHSLLITPFFFKVEVILERDIFPKTLKRHESNPVKKYLYSITQTFIAFLDSLKTDYVHSKYLLYSTHTYINQVL